MKIVNRDYFVDNIEEMNKYIFFTFGDCILLFYPNECVKHYWDYNTMYFEFEQDGVDYDVVDEMGELPERMIHKQLGTYNEYLMLIRTLKIEQINKK